MKTLELFFVLAEYVFVFGLGGMWTAFAVYETWEIVARVRAERRRMK